MSQYDSRVDVEYASIRETVAISGRSLSTIRRALKSGVLPHSRVGLGRGQVRIALPDLARFLTPRPVLRDRVERRDPDAGQERRDPAARSAFLTGARDKGFTLIELLVAVILIGILAGVAVPVFMNQKAKAADAAVQADLKHLSAAAEDWYVDHNAYPADAAGWTAATPPSVGTTIRAFTATTVPAGYVVYGKSARSGSSVFVLSSFTGSVPTRTGLSALPETPPAAGTLGVGAGATWQSWATVGGSDWGTDAVTRDVLSWSDPGLLYLTKILTNANAVDGWDGAVASDGTDTSWTITAVTDCPVTGHAAVATLGDAAHIWGITTSPYPASGVTPPSSAFLVAGTTYTISIWVKADAGTPLAFAGRVERSNWGWVATVANSSFTASGSWQRLTGTCTATAAQADGTTYVGVTVASRANAGAVAGTRLFVSAVQVSRGAVATPFQQQVV